MPRGSRMKNVKVETLAPKVREGNETLGSKPIMTSQGESTSSHTSTSTSTTNISHIFFQ